MTAVDDAYERYLRLNDIVRSARQSALAQPTSTRNRELGIIAPDDKRADAEQKLESAFDHMLLQVQCCGILDLCSAFEDAFRKRVATAIGETRRVVDSHYQIKVMTRLRYRLLRDARSFESLASIFEAVDGLVSVELATSLRKLRDERNRIAHLPMSQAPKFEADDVRILLNELIDAIW